MPGSLWKNPQKVAPEKGAGIRKFNVFVDDAYYAVEVESEGGAMIAAPVVTQVAAAPKPAAPAAAPKPAAAAQNRQQHQPRPRQQEVQERLKRPCPVSLLM